MCLETIYSEISSIIKPYWGRELHLVHQLLDYPPASIYNDAEDYNLLKRLSPGASFKWLDSAWDLFINLPEIYQISWVYKICPTFNARESAKLYFWQPNGFGTLIERSHLRQAWSESYYNMQLSPLDRVRILYNFVPYSDNTPIGDWVLQNTKSILPTRIGIEEKELSNEDTYIISKAEYRLSIIDVCELQLDFWRLLNITDKSYISKIDWLINLKDQLTQKMNNVTN